MYTYNPENINLDNTDFISVVRFLIADTDVTATTGEISDEEITALYSDSVAGSEQAIRNVMTAYNAAKYLQRKYSKQVSFSSAGTSVNLSDRVEHWAEVVQDLAYKLISVANQQPVTYPARPSAFLNY